MIERKNREIRRRKKKRMLKERKKERKKERRHDPDSTKQPNAFTLKIKLKMEALIIGYQ